ncbi:MAG TPA: NAD(P)-dependent oxidoreductase [candidate division Zixibacteria bacterium]|nr:NAD(P)-dependent oxidoreductase [candidate division Zixibacteria bacterium]
MRVLVTGGTGFIGSHIVDRLISNGHEPLVAIRETSSLKWLPNEVETIIAPMERLSPLEKILPNIDAVIHNAGVIRAKRKEDFYRVNLTATVDLAELCAKYAKNLRKFVFVSSQAAGRPGRDCDGVCESTEPAPITSYGHSKLEAERALKDFSELFPVAIIRPPVVYGPRDVSVLTYFKMVSKGFKVFPGDSGRQFSIVYVKDLARAIVTAIEYSECFSLFFVNDGEVHTWRELADIIAEEMDRRTLTIQLPKAAFYPAAMIARGLSMATGDIPLLTMEKAREISGNWVCDGSAICERMGFEPEFDLHRGIAETVRWYRDIGWI